jgi:NADPH:quinone reductase-like Zn-dependent oxidoreductase
MLRRLGADHFIDYAEEDFSRSGQFYNGIFSMVANTPYSACLMANPKLSDMLRSVLTVKPAAKTAVFAFARESREELFALKEMLEDVRIRPGVDRIFTMEPPIAGWRVNSAWAPS